MTNEVYQAEEYIEGIGTMLHPDTPFGYDNKLAGGTWKYTGTRRGFVPWARERINDRAAAVIERKGLEQTLDTMLSAWLVSDPATSRYTVLPVSQSGHCCFEATVVDTTKPSTAVAGQFEAVCECFTLGQANLVATALNLLPKEQHDR